MNTQKECFLNLTRCMDVDDVTDRLEPGALASPFRSTFPLLSLFKHRSDIVDALLESLSIRPTYSVHFEYEVAPVGVDGNPSQTDAMLLSESTSCAIEAKWTEPRYETVRGRIDRVVKKQIARSEGVSQSNLEAAQELNVQGWLSYIQRHALQKLDIDDVSDVVYQMLHRAASACSTSRSPVLLYLHFCPSPAPSSAKGDQYIRDLNLLFELMGRPASFRMGLVEVPISLKADFLEIKDLRKGVRETDATVRSVAKNGMPFGFGAPKVEMLE